MVRQYHRTVMGKCPPSKVKRKVVRDATASGGKMVGVSNRLGYLGNGVEIEETVAKRFIHEFIQTPEII